MRTLTATAFVSLDGVMQAPGGEPGYAHAGWVAAHFTPELGAYKEAEQLAAGVLLVGRRTYEGFAGAWPGREGAMAEKLNTMTKYVASTTLSDPEWQPTTVIADDLPGAVRALKDGGNGPILIAGSRSVVHQLLDAGLIDEINLQVLPVVLASGERFYPDRSEPIELELAASEAMPSGVLAQTYRVRR